MSTTSHPAFPGVVWRKSSFSNGSGGECVEVASTPDRTLVRDSKDAAGPVLAFSAAAWAAFVAEVRGGALRGAE